MTSSQRRAYRAGQILGTAGGVCVVVICEAESDDVITCAGAPLVAERPLPCSTTYRHRAHDVRPGDVLWDPATGLELRCIRGGRGPLVHGGRAMVRR
jgi:hypothetical protein